MSKSHLNMFKKAEGFKGREQCFMVGVGGGKGEEYQESR